MENNEEVADFSLIISSHHLHRPEPTNERWVDGRAKLVFLAHPKRACEVFFLLRTPDK